MSDVTQLLTELGAGNPRAAEELLPLVYDNLRQLAAAGNRRSNPARRCRR
ncbi:MAG: ECF-type sigma factor [Verrucomicrobiota bacterium]